MGVCVCIDFLWDTGKKEVIGDILGGQAPESTAMQ